MRMRGGRPVTAIAKGRRAITAVYKGPRLVWMAVRSCFGSGVWMNRKAWLDKETWKDG